MANDKLRDFWHELADKAEYDKYDNTAEALCFHVCDLVDDWAVLDTPHCEFNSQSFRTKLLHCGISEFVVFADVLRT